MLTKINPKYKPYLIAGIILVVLIIIYFVFLRKKDQEQPEVIELGTGENTDTISVEEKLFENCPNDTFPLKYGKCGANVERMQIFLMRNYGEFLLGEDGTSEFGADGKWGNETSEAVMRALKRDNVSEDYFFKVGMNNENVYKFI